MAELTVPNVDFSSLGQLPELYRQNQATNLRQQTLSSLGQGGTADAQALLRSGDLSLAQLGMTMQQREAERARQAQTDARQAERDKVTDSHWSSDYALRKAAAARANDPTPTNFVADANAPGGYRPIGPADPAYIESIAAARARAAAAIPPDGFTQGAGGALMPRPGGPTDPAYLESVAAAKARAAASLPPDNFVVGADGSLSPRSGGPTDPAYLARVEAERARAKGDLPTIMGPGSSVIIPNKASEGPLFRNTTDTSSGLSPESLEIRARQWNNGDYEGATKNVGRGAQGSKTLEAIANKSAELLIAGGASPEAAAAHVSSNMQKFRASGIGQSAEARTSANREANLNLILKATDAAIPAALEQSEKVSRTGWVPINQIIQKGQVIASNPELRKFGMANLQLAEHWARAMNPTGVMRESDRDLALHFLSTADSKDTYKEVVGQLKTQITRERDSIRGSSAPTAAQTELKNKYGLD